MRIKAIKIPPCMESYSNIDGGPKLSVMLCPRQLPKIAATDNIQEVYSLTNSDIDMVWDLTAYTEAGEHTPDLCIRGDSNENGAVFLSYLEFVTGLSGPITSDSAPENPEPENPEPENPEPENPVPENPVPENPVPENSAENGRVWVLFPPYYNYANCLNSKLLYSGITKGPCLPNAASPDYLYTPTFIPHTKVRGGGGGRIECEAIVECILEDPDIYDILVQNIINSIINDGDIINNLTEAIVNSIINNSDIINNLTESIVNSIINNSDIINNLTESIVNEIINNGDIIKNLTDSILGKLSITGGNFITVTGTGSSGFTVSWDGEVGPCPEEEE